jgi:hypothetical protein
VVQRIVPERRVIDLAGIRLGVRDQFGGCVRRKARVTTASFPDETMWLKPMPRRARTIATTIVPLCNTNATLPALAALGEHALVFRIHRIDLTGEAQLLKIAGITL